MKSFGHYIKYIRITYKLTKTIFVPDKNNIKRSKRVHFEASFWSIRITLISRLAIANIYKQQLSLSLYT